jgi:hypothetical protein
MCDITAGIALASALLGAAGSIQQGNAAAAASKYNAKVSDMNARISDRRALDALERGKVEEQNKRREIAQFKGRQEAAMSANGVDLNFGSPLDTLVDTAVMGELDALTVRSNSAREAYGFKVDAANKVADANLSRMNASAQTTSGYLTAAGTLLSGVGNAWGTYKKGSIGAYA